MTAFHYIALDAKGKRKKGVIEADNARNVRAQLRERGLTPIEVDLVRERLGGEKKTTSLRGMQRKRVSAADLSLLTRQLATLLAAGIPLDDALTGVAEQSEKSHVNSILLGVRGRVLEGYALAASMDEYPNAFPKLYRTNGCRR